MHALMSYFGLHYIGSLALIETLLLKLVLCIFEDDLSQSKYPISVVGSDSASNRPNSSNTTFH